MKNDDPYLRIKQMRYNYNCRDLIPYTNYKAKNNRSKRLLKAVYRSIKDKVSLKEAAIQFVIADVTALEVYFRDFFHACFEYSIDKRKFLEKCEKLVDKRFSFQDLIIISHDEIQLCDLVIENNNFQNLDNVNKVFSTVIKEHFFDSLNNLEFEVWTTGKNSKKYVLTLHENWYQELDEYLKLRHNLTHDFNPKLKIDRDRIEHLHINTEIVISALNYIFLKEIIEPFFENQKNVKKNNN